MTPLVRIVFTNKLPFIFLGEISRLGFFLFFKFFFIAVNPERQLGLKILTYGVASS